MLLLAEEMVEEFATFLNITAAEIQKNPFAQNKYNLQYVLGEYIILRIDGPRNDDYQKTCHLELKGMGCRDFEERNPDKTWVEFMLFLYNLNAKFTRIDIAIDDFSGEDINLEWLQNKTKKKNYTSIFKSKVKPKGSLEDGLTLNFGNHKSKTELCIYDKLKEQESKKIENDKTYWVRYEMRFRHEKAEKIAYLFMLEDETESEDQYKFNLQQLALSLLYGLIDFKVDNDKSEASQKNQATDPKYLNFLQNVSKGTLKSDKPKESSFEQYIRYSIPYISSYLLITYFKVNKDLNLFNLEIYKLFKNNIKFSKRRFHKLNIYLKKMGIKPITDEDIEKLTIELTNIVEESELPF